MNLITKLLSITSLSLFFACSGHTEIKQRSTDSIKNVFAQELKNKTLPEARTFLNNQSEQLDELLDMMNHRIEFSISSIVKNPTGDEGVYTEPIHTLIPAETVEAGMKEVARNFNFSQQINEKNSLLIAQQGNLYPNPDFYSNNDKNRSLLRWSLNFNQIFFHDKSVSKEKIVLEAAKDATIKERKIIDSAQATLKYSYVTKAEEILLDKNTLSKKTPYGSIELKELSADGATLQINGRRENILAIAGMDTKGRYIESNATNSYSVPSEGKQKILEIYSKALKSWVKKIDSKQYKTTAALIEDIKKTMPPELASEEMQKENVEVTSFHFYQNVAKVVVLYAMEEKTIDQRVSLKNTTTTGSAYSIAQGAAQGMFGIVSADGQWVVKPTYPNLENISPYYYRTCVQGNSEMQCTYYRFDPAQQKMISLNTTALKGYGIDGELGPNYVQFSKEINSNLSLKGVADNQGNIILKPINHEIDIAGNYFITFQPSPKSSDSYESAMYTLDGKTVIAASPQVIFPDNGYIFVDATPAESDELQKYRLLDDQTGKHVLPEGTYALESKFISNLLLVGNGSQKYYIDTKLRKKFDVSGYKELGRFMGGYVEVTNNAGLKGYINTAGKLIVPCVYEDLTPVVHEITMVSKDVNNAYQYGLLNVLSGKFVVPLAKAENYSSYGSDEKIIYTLNDKKYNYAGKLIPGGK